MIQLFLCSRWGRILALLAVLGAAYQSDDLYASGRDYFRWRSEHYSVGYGPCYNCFREVGYWQEKGKGPRGVETVCGYCGLTNTYMQDTVPREAEQVEQYSISGYICWNCKKSITLRQDKGKAVDGASGECQACGVVGHLNLKKAKETT